VHTRQSLIASRGFTTFGGLLRFLRRRARLTQRELGLAVGYSEAQISRLEQGHRLPDPATVGALFLPALRLGDEPELASRLLDLASSARARAARDRATANQAAADRPTVADPLAAPVPLDAGIPEARRPPAGVLGVGARDAGGLDAGVEGVPRPRLSAETVRRTELAAAIPAAPAHLVERPDELRTLDARLHAERLTVLCGLAGTGKTVLAAALARASSGTQRVCWLTATAADPPVTADLLAVRLAAALAAKGGYGAPDHARRRTAAELRDRPTLICVDNAHHLRAVPDALTLLAELAQTSDTRVLLVSREELPTPGTAVVRLTGLRTTEGRALVTSVRAPAHIPVSLADRLLTRTAGNPMLLRLALGHLTGDDPDTPLLLDRLAAQPEIAAYLQETMLGGLEPDGERLVGVLSVFRRPVDLHDETLVELCHGTDGRWDLLGAVRELQRRQLIDHPARATLHPLLRDHGYATLLADVSRRRRLHRIAAEWSERVAGDVLEAAWHYTRAGAAATAADLLAAAAPDILAQGRGSAAADLAGRLLGMVRTQATPDPDVLHRLGLVRTDLLTARGAPDPSH
jgi:transcriptional regulator with XRE-family HTH domain